MRTATLLAILIGGAAGAAVALSRAPSETQRPPPKLAPVAARPVQPERPAEVTRPPLPSTPSAPSAPFAPAQAASSSAPASALLPAPAVASIGSKEELTRQEVACQEMKEPLACRAAALAYEEGKVVKADPTKARLFRRIELTFVVKGCESHNVQSCIELSRRYEQGEGVEQNTRTARALLERAKELCGQKKTPQCAELGAMAREQ